MSFFNYHFKLQLDSYFSFYENAIKPKRAEMSNGKETQNSFAISCSGSTIHIIVSTMPMQNCVTVQCSPNISHLSRIRPHLTTLLFFSSLSKSLLLRCTSPINKFVSIIHNIVFNLNLPLPFPSTLAQKRSIRKGTKFPLPSSLIQKEKLKVSLTSY